MMFWRTSRELNPKKDNEPGQVYCLERYSYSLLAKRNVVSIHQRNNEDRQFSGRKVRPRGQPSLSLILHAWKLQAVHTDVARPMFDPPSRQNAMNKCRATSSSIGIAPVLAMCQHSSFAMLDIRDSLRKEVCSSSPAHSWPSACIPNVLWNMNVYSH